MKFKIRISQLIAKILLKQQSLNQINVIIFIQTILSFVLLRKIINIYNYIAWKYGNVTVKEKLEYKKNKLKLYINYLSNCKQLVCIPNSLFLGC